MQQLLEIFLSNAKPRDFPNEDRLGYAKRYETIANFLNTYEHPSVTRLADIANLGTDGEGFLTDHGPEHIETVIRRASALTEDGNGCIINPYETYCLLLAIHIHDVGNKHGRKYHERRSDETLLALGPMVGDTRELKIIWQIAQAHGGHTPDGSRDKIVALAEEVDILDSHRVKQRLLAAILRFADELADDYTRATRYVSGENQILKASEIFHEYAMALRSVRVNLERRAVELQFQLDETTSTTLYGKGKDFVYLLDEIYLRTLKMYAELRYCNRFMSDFVKIERIKVNIDCDHGSQFSVALYPSIRYTLEESGYPKIGSINEMCLIVDNDGKAIDGQSLSDKVTLELERRMTK